MGPLKSFGHGDKGSGASRWPEFPYPPYSFMNNYVSWIMGEAVCERETRREAIVF